MCCILPIHMFQNLTERQETPNFTSFHIGIVNQSNGNARKDKDPD